MKAEYDFSGGVRGKYLPQLAQGAHVVVLDRDMAKTLRATHPKKRAFCGAARMVYSKYTSGSTAIVRQ